MTLSLQMAKTWGQRVIAYVCVYVCACEYTHTHTHTQFIYFTLCMSVLPVCTHVHHSQVHTEVRWHWVPQL